MSRRTAACLCLLALLATAAGAQDHPAADRAGAAAAAPPAEGGRAAPDQDRNATAAKDAPKDAAPPAAKSPDEFRPSEHISEDLSVSFPADI